MKLDKGVVILFVIFLGGFLFLFKPWIHSADPVGYYSWLRSAVIDRDINLANEFKHYKSELDANKEEIITLETGYVVNRWAIGSAILWFPFFVAAHAVLYIASVLGFSVVRDGYSAPYVWAISIGSALYGCAAVLFTYHLCRKYFSLKISVLAVVTGWLGTTLVYYMYSHPSMSHANDAFCYALFLLAWHRTQRSQVLHSAVFRGVTLGLCALVRQINGIFVFFIIGEYAINGLRKWKDTNQPGELKKAVFAIIVFSLFWWITYFPQVIVWRTVFGQWILNPYGFLGEHFNFNPLHTFNIVNVLFSTNRGLLLWTPLVILALIGLKYLWRENHSLTALVTINFALLLFMISSWHFWYAGTGPGNRYFTNMVPVFILGLGALLKQLEKYISFRWITTFCIMAVMWYGIILMRYAVGDIPRWGYVPLDKLILGQFAAVPKYFWRVIQIILTRS